MVVEGALVVGEGALVVVEGVPESVTTLGTRAEVSTVVETTWQSDSRQISRETSVMAGIELSPRAKSHCGPLSHRVVAFDVHFRDPD